ncbi:NUDIX domain-containing protein [Ruegeria sp. AD91A]|uniref:NUDIX hydrolase n=1 Tax=Ruegeria sp. AD91A TaxID=2293862 RepID=UPI000E49904D|nr:NUDIX hydrolase [Ruegeria sp. AD91A]AXT26773.1 NUDIX domain-containing protein [Ruegeria sp. AD91A]
MSAWLQNIWEEVGRPLFLRPRRVQFAALCTRIHDGMDEVLLITSRDTRRWIIPKGWPIDGLSGAETALQEAWEEAGVRGDTVHNDPIGRYTYDKILKDGSAQPVLASVYRVSVRALAEEFPEADQRERRWFSPADAATQVQEPELQALLRNL